jgi:hypothetical protein
MDTINKNLTPEQETSIKEQDVTKTNGAVDLEVLETQASDLPEAPVTNDNTNQTLSVAESLNQANELQRQRTAEAQAEAQKQAIAQADQEAVVRTIAGETLGQGAAETQALADSGISESQQAIDALDQAILNSSKALKMAMVQDERDVQSLAGQGRGIPASVVRGRQALLQSQRRADRKVEAIELENDIATSELLQGKVDSAKKAIQRSVELQFADKKAELEIEKEFLSRVDTKEANARKEAISREEKMMEKAQAEADDVFSIAEEARKQGASAEEVNSIIKSKNRKEALSNANSLGQLARLDMQLKNLNIQSKSLDIKEQKKKLEELSNPDSGLSIKPDFQAATFAKRMYDANQVLKETERGVGEKIGSIATLGLSNRSERQARDQAERNFINALLRKESGAAISPEEFESAKKQYFPTSTDTEETRKQKEENRNVVFEGMRISSGDAYDYLVNEIETGSPETLLESINIEEAPQDFFSDL